MPTLRTRDDYRYEPLREGQIRLLRLSFIHTRLVPSSIRKRYASISLRAYNLDTAPPYFALSYAWEDGIEEKKIRCNGRLLEITASLLEALPFLNTYKDPGDPPVTYFWVDQLCINQRDREERSQQVNIMGAIFAQAARVLVWLGPGDENTTEILETLRLVRDRVDNKSPRGAWTYQELEDAYLPDHDSTRWEHVGAFLQRPWFRRKWVLQEIVLSSREPSYMVGRHIIPWTELMHCLIWAHCSINHVIMRDSLVVIASSMLHTARNCNYHKQDNIIQAELEYLLRNTDELECKDPRDNIYAMLGLTRDLGIRADYTKSIDLLFPEVTRLLITESQRLDILDLATDSKPTPSWCISFRTTESRERRLRIWFQRYIVIGSQQSITIAPPPLSASSPRVVQLHECQNDRELQLGGLKVDTISWVCEGFIPVGAPGDVYAYKLIHDIWEPYLKYLGIPQDPRHPRLNAAVKAFLKVLELGHDYQDELLQRGQQTPVSNFWAWLSSWARDLSDSVWADDYVASVLAEDGDGWKTNPQLPGYCLFMTDRGYVGFAAGDTPPKVGQQLYVLFGGYPVYVLEPHLHGHKLVGQAYIDEYMRGRAIEMLEEGQFEETVVRLL